MHEELENEVGKVLRTDDVFYLTDVYYAGGTVTKDVTSEMVAEAMYNKGFAVKYIPDRKNLISEFKSKVQSGDVILLMGARDTTMSEFAKELFDNVV